MMNAKKTTQQPARYQGRTQHDRQRDGILPTVLQEGKMTMAYADFDVKKVQTDFQLELIEDQDVFAQIQEIDIGSA